MCLTVLTLSVVVLLCVAVIVRQDCAETSPKYRSLCANMFHTKNSDYKSRISWRHTIISRFQEADHHLSCFPKRLRLCAFLRTHTYANTHTHAHLLQSECTHTDTDTKTCARARTPTHLWLSTHACIHARTHASTQVHTQAHTSTLFWLNPRTQKNARTANTRKTFARTHTRVHTHASTSISSSLAEHMFLCSVQLHG